MAVQDPPLFLQSDSHPAKYFRQFLAAIMGSPLGAFASGVTVNGVVPSGGGGYGIANEGDLLVTQHSTPNMSVDVAAGRGFVHGTEATDQAVYLITNDALTNPTVAAADPTNPRVDVVVAQVRDAGGGYSGSSDDARITVVTGTPAGSPTIPTLPVNCLPLARIAVAAGATSITNANITDVRRLAYALGGTVVCTSANRPTVATRVGSHIYETDSTRDLIVTATPGVRSVGKGIVGKAQSGSDQGSITTIVDVTSLSVTITALESHWYLIMGFALIQSNTANDSFALTIADGSNNQLQQANTGAMPQANVPHQLKVMAYHQPASPGSFTYKLRIARASGSGTGTLKGASTFPLQILVLDMGSLGDL